MTWIASTKEKVIKQLQEHLLEEIPHLDKDSAHDMAEQMYKELKEK